MKSSRDVTNYLSLFVMFKAMLAYGSQMVLLIWSISLFVFMLSSTINTQGELENIYERVTSG